MADRVVEQLDQIISRLEVRLERLRAFRDLVNDDPAFVAEIQHVLLDHESNGVLNPERAAAARQPEAPRFERVKEFLAKLEKAPWRIKSSGYTLAH